MLLADSIGAAATDALICGLAVVVMIVGTVPMGFLSGIGMVRTQSIVILLGTLLRLATGWPLMVSGFGVVGAVGGYFTNYALVLGLSYVLCVRSLTRAPKHPVTIGPPPQLRLSTISTFALTFAPFGLDQFLVQAFSPELGGSYAALSTMSKLVFFGVLPIVAIVYPRLLAEADQGRRLGILTVAMIGLVVIAFGLTVFLSLYPEQVTRFFYASRFSEIPPEVGRMALGVAFFSVSALAAHALIAWSNPYGYIPSLVAQLIGVAMYAWQSGSLEQVVSNQLAIYAVQMVLTCGLLAFSLSRKKDAGLTK